eukprot:4585424-Prymnesium_polylepis.2
MRARRRGGRAWPVGLGGRLRRGLSLAHAVAHAVAHASAHASARGLLGRRAAGCRRRRIELAIEPVSGAEHEHVALGEVEPAEAADGEEG